MWRWSEYLLQYLRTLGYYGIVLILTSGFRVICVRYISSYLHYICTSGKKPSGFQPGHNWQNTCQKCEKRSRKCEKHVEMTGKRFLWHQTRKKWYRDFWIPIFVQNSRSHNQARTLTRRQKFAIYLVYKRGCSQKLAQKMVFAESNKFLTTR